MVVPRVHEHEPARIVHPIASTHTEEHIYRARGRRCARWPHVYTENRDLSPETLSMAVKMCTASLAARQWLKLQRWVGPASLLHAHGWWGSRRTGGARRGECRRVRWVPRCLQYTRKLRIHGARRQAQDQRRHTCSRTIQDVLNTTVHLRALENTAIVLAGGAAFAYTSYIVKLRF